MEAVAWILLFILIMTGIAGTFLPGIPGLGIILAGAIIHKVILPQFLTWYVITTVGILALVAWWVDLLGYSLGAKWAGASRWGIFGALAGGIVGIAFAPFGLIAGPIIGAFLGELVAAKTPQQAARSGFGAGLGFAISTVLRFLLAIAAVTLIVIDLIVS